MTKQPPLRLVFMRRVSAVVAGFLMVSGCNQPAKTRDETPDPQSEPALTSPMTPVAKNKAVSFPEAEKARAPSGTFAVQSITHSSSDDGLHEVRLVDQRTGKSCWSRKFARSLDVLWSPGGSAVAVTDWIGSNVSELDVIIPAEMCTPVSVAKELFKSLGESAFPKNPDHIYWQAKSWRTPDTLEFRVSGDWVDKERKEFDKTFEYRLGGEVKPLRNSADVRKTP